MKKTALEHFKDIKELETADGPKVTVEDILPCKCEKVEKALECWEIVKPYLKVGIDYGTDRDVSVAVLTFIDSKKTIYVLDQATKEINPEHFAKLETLKEGLK